VGRRRRRARLRWGTVLVLLLVAAGAYIGQSHSAAAPHASRQPTAHRPAHVRSLVPIAWVPQGSKPNVPLHEPDAVLAVYGQPDRLFQQNPNQPGPIASTTKLMTAYLVAQTLPMNQVVAITPTAAATGGSDMRMDVGEHFTVRQLLTGMLMVSANDAAVALAEAVAGHTQTFVALMNRTAVALGLHHTHYADPDGISPESSSSAADLLRLAELDLAIPAIRHIVDTKTANLPNNPNVININGLLWRDPTVIGLKTGWTSAAECTLVFAATRSVEGHPVTLVGVLLHARLFNTEYDDAEALLNWGFSAVAPTMDVLAYEHRVPSVLTP
jgi:D-alanyl-D-alanine carboxypeptidase (penicillin-binding protein 5/6)